MTPLQEGMVLESLEGLPKLPEDDEAPLLREAPVRDVEVLIVGGGPAGLSAAIELGKLGIDTLILDDKQKLGGKLLLQTHKFFGSVEDSHAGTRGFEIARMLEEDVRKLSSVDVWLNTTAWASSRWHCWGGKGEDLRENKPGKTLVLQAQGKRSFFRETRCRGLQRRSSNLVNRDLVKLGKGLIVGGGNVGLIAGYHAIQAGIEVAALVEALPHVGGYKVHEDKLKRLGVPFYTSHTVVSASGHERVESVTIAKLDEKWKVIPGTHKTFDVDTVLIAVGLAEVNEFYAKAREWEWILVCG
jgi:NADPH-dependent 2,4-dienoyl-CoA reductase/sulfur reductase-like enzyme